MIYPSTKTYSPDLVLQAVSEEYLLGERIEISAALVNHSPMALVVNYRFQMIWDYKYREAYELQFDVLGPQGEEILPRKIIEDRLVPYPKKKDFVYLDPGDSRQRTVVISDYFDFDDAGIYQISAEYHNDHTEWRDYTEWHPDSLVRGEGLKIIPVDAWTGTIRSNSIQLRVKSAAG